MVIISNSSRRSSTTMEKIKSLGFDPSMFVGAITSGELTHQNLQRCTIISPMEKIKISEVTSLYSLFDITMVVPIYILHLSSSYVKGVSISQHTQF